MSKDKSDPAFPAPDAAKARFGSDNPDMYMGMTLRDYFAAKAMQAGLCTLQSPGAVDSAVKRANQLGLEVEVMFAQDSYVMADAMLAARSA